MHNVSVGEFLVIISCTQGCSITTYYHGWICQSDISYDIWFLLICLDNSVGFKNTKVAIFGFFIFLGIFLQKKTIVRCIKYILFPTFRCLNQVTMDPNVLWLYFNKLIYCIIFEFFWLVKIQIASSKFRLWASYLINQF